MIDQPEDRTRRLEEVSLLTIVTAEYSMFLYSQFQFWRPRPAKNSHRHHTLEVHRDFYWTPPHQAREEAKSL